MEGELHRTTWFVWREGVSPFRYSSSVMSSFSREEHVRAAVCSTGSISSRKGTAKAAVREWHRDTAEERFREDSEKFPER